METKICSRCKIEKNINEFNKNRSKSAGINSECRDCAKKYSAIKRKCPDYINYKKEYRKKNAEKIKQKRKEYYEKNSKKENQQSKIYKQNNVEKIKEQAKIWRQKNIDIIKEKEKIRRKRDRNKTREVEKKYRYKNIERLNRNKRERFKNDPQFRLSITLRNRIRDAIKNYRGIKNQKSTDLVGCSWNELKNYLENKFKDGMTWENYGVHGWHIDHIRPCKSFDLTDPEQQKECFHYTNLQPLWWWENLEKGGKWENTTSQ